VRPTRPPTGTTWGTAATSARATRTAKTTPATSTTTASATTARQGTRRRALRNGIGTVSTRGPRRCRPAAGPGPGSSTSFPAASPPAPPQGSANQLVSASGGSASGTHPLRVPTGGVPAPAPSAASCAASRARRDAVSISDSRAGSRGGGERRRGIPATLGTNCRAGERPGEACGRWDPVTVGCGRAAATGLGATGAQRGRGEATTASVPGPTCAPTTAPSSATTR